MVFTKLLKLKRGTIKIKGIFWSCWPGLLVTIVATDWYWWYWRWWRCWKWCLHTGRRQCLVCRCTAGTGKTKHSDSDISHWSPDHGFSSFQSFSHRWKPRAWSEQNFWSQLGSKELISLITCLLLSSLENDADVLIVSRISLIKSLENLSNIELYLS